MGVFEIVSALLAAAIVLVWVVYLVEAFGQSPGQGLLLLLAPIYAYYFAQIRSAKGAATRGALFGATALLLALNLVRALGRG